jgi:hypothetical protein
MTRDVIYTPKTKEVPVPGSPVPESFSEEEREMMDVDDNSQPPYAHEVTETGEISMCFYHPEGTEPVNRPIWAGQEVQECSRFEEKKLTGDDDGVV